MYYRSKYQWIKKYIQNKKVLDLGCVDHRINRTDRPWLHGLICRNAESVVGVDYMEGEVCKLNTKGFNVVNADVENMDLGETFDVIVAGDIIEHLSNPGKLFERVNAHLNPEGLFLVTTPNPITTLRVLKILRYGVYRSNPEHTCWFTREVLIELAQRYCFAMVDESYVDDSRLSFPFFRKYSGPKETLKDRIRSMYVFLDGLCWMPFVLINSALCLLRPRLSETLCLAFTRY